MLLQVGRLVEGLAANGARKGPLSRMYPLVPHEVARQGELLLAEAALQCGAFVALFVLGQVFSLEKPERGKGKKKDNRSEVTTFSRYQIVNDVSGLNTQCAPKYLFPHSLHSWGRSPV
jgi:hypothetical protein